MYVEQALNTHLLAQSGLTALIGEKIYYLTAPQDVEEPYIVMTQVDAPAESSLTGTLGLTKHRFQFSIFSETLYAARLIRDQLHAALHGKHEVIQTLYLTILYENELEMYETETGIYHLAVDYIVMN